MTEENNTGEQITEAPVQEAVREQVQPMSDADILKAAAAFDAGTAAAEPEADEGGVDEAGEEDSAEDAGHEEVVEEAEQPKQAKGKGKGAEARIKELNTKANEWKAQAEEAKALLAEERKKTQNLAEVIKKVIPGEEPEPEPADEIIDEALDKKTANEFAKRDAEAAFNSFCDAAEKADQIGAASNPKYSEAVAIVLASDAYKIIVSNAAQGIEVSDEEAMNQAKRENAIELMRVHAANKRNPAKMAEYMIHRASVLGYQTADKPSAPAKQKSTVDMQAVDRFRKEAGAPVLKRESAATVGAADWGSQVAASFKEKYGTVDRDYLRKMGIQA